VISDDCSADFSSKSLPPVVDFCLLRSGFRRSCWPVDICSWLQFPQLRSRDLIFPVHSSDSSPAPSLVSLGSLLGPQLARTPCWVLASDQRRLTPELDFAFHETSLISVISCRRSSRRDRTPARPFCLGRFFNSAASPVCLDFHCCVSDSRWLQVIPGMILESLN
jgi:hypothetical protein